ncbi:MAG: calcium/sodium antiporter [Flavobacteriaceae bacterium]
MIILYILALLLAFYLLMKVCDEYFVSSLDKIAKNLNLSSEASGATLMAVGTSAPELFVSLMALLRPGDHGAMGAGTIVGSAIFNILVIIGGSLVIRKAHILWQPVIRDTIFYLFAIVLLLFSFRDGTIDLFEAGTFLAIYIIYVFAVVKWKKLLKYEEKDLEEIVEKTKEAENRWLKKVATAFTFILDKTFPGPQRYYLTFFISIGWIIALSWLLVEGGIGIAHELGVPEVIIGLTILAAGTSIPDLISSLIVAKEGRGDMAISNAIGSNIFDILIGLGLPWVIMLVFFKDQILVDNTNLSSSIMLLMATIICIFFLFVFQKWKMGRKSGLFLIFLYVAYLIWLIANAIN